MRLGVMVAVGLCVLSGALQAQTKSAESLRLTPNHATASVADLEKEANWYRDVLGFKRSELMGAGTEFQAYHMTLPGYRIDLVWQKGSVRQRGTKGAQEQGWLHIVFNTPDLDAAYKYLVSRGITVRENRDAQGHVEHLNFNDPEGNEIGMAQTP